MTDDFLTLKMLIISEAAAEREFVLRAAAGAPIPIEVTEAVTPGNAAATTELLARAPYDIVSMPSGQRKAGPWRS